MGLKEIVKLEVAGKTADDCVTVPSSPKLEKLVVKLLVEPAGKLKEDTDALIVKSAVTLRARETRWVIDRLVPVMLTV
jgi:hypothetical protein